MTAPSPAVRVGPEATRAAVHIRVEGIPAPQGSHRAFIVGKPGSQRAVIVNDSPKTRPWKDAVRDAARLALLDHPGPWTPISGAVEVVLTCWLPRPKSHYGTGRNTDRLKDSSPDYPTVKPDCDKLLRAALDSLGEAGVWTDGAQVVEAHSAKRYAERYPHAPMPVGAAITVRPVR